MLCENTPKQKGTQTRYQFEGRFDAKTESEHQNMMEFGKQLDGYETRICLGSEIGFQYHFNGFDFDFVLFAQMRKHASQTRNAFMQSFIFAQPSLSFDPFQRRQRVLTSANNRLAGNSMVSERFCFSET